MNGIFIAIFKEYYFFSSYFARRIAKFNFRTAWKLFSGL
jgi:hypothetical protein